MPHKAGCAGSNKVSNCCNYITRKEMLGHPCVRHAKKCKTCNLGYIIVSML